MEPQSTNPVQAKSQSVLFKVTPLSKYFAMGLFIALPFLGGWIGYTYAPEKIVEVEHIVSSKVDQERAVPSDMSNDVPEAIAQNQNESVTPAPEWVTYSNEDFSIQYPSDRGWVFEDDNFDPIGVAFGTPQSRPGGFIWSANAVNTSEVDLETLISKVGLQFSDRQEVRKDIVINGVPALLVTVSTKQVQDGWVFNSVYIDGATVNRPGRIYIISDGAVTEPGFEQFYNSFKFNN